MEKIDNFLNHVYGSSQSLLYFYVALGAIALFFIILTLIILFTTEDISRKRYLKKEKQKELKTGNESIEENTLNKSEEKEKLEENKEKSLSETQVFNNILMGKNEENIENEKVDIPKDNLDDIKNNEKIEKPQVVKTVFDNDFYLEKELLPVDDEINKDPDSIDIKDNEETRNLESEFESEPEPEDKALEDYTIEMPKVKPMDLDDYLFRRERETTQEIKEEKVEEEKEVEKEVISKTETVEEPAKVELSNDELKNRLAKLKAKKEEKEDVIPDSDLENLMKAVGLEDTTVIPKLKDEEKQILGK